MDSCWEGLIPAVESHITRFKRVAPGTYIHAVHRKDLADDDTELRLLDEDLRPLFLIVGASSHFEAKMIGNVDPRADRIEKLKVVQCKQRQILNIAPDHRSLSQGECDQLVTRV